MAEYDNEQRAKDDEQSKECFYTFSWRECVHGF